MLSRLLYMIPFFGMFTGVYFLYTFDLAAAYLVSGLALVQSVICLAYLFTQILHNGTDGTLEVEGQLWDAMMPVIFLMLSATSFLYLTIHNLQGV